MAIFSSHILNSINGTHADGVTVSIFQITPNGEKNLFFESKTDAMGRILKEFELKNSDRNCDYELVCNIGKYFSEKRIVSEVIIKFKMSNQETLEHILDVLDGEEGISFKRMFGGYGLFKNELAVALILRSEIFMKVDQSNINDYKSAFSKPFTYKKNGKDISLSNWSIPSEILEDKDLFIEWFLKSYRVALDKKIGKKVEY